jgi:hypothetical protein
MYVVQQVLSWKTTDSTVDATSEIQIVVSVDLVIKLIVFIPSAATVLCPVFDPVYSAL